MDKKTEIPGFELINIIGRGGMAVVWKARQISLDRIVAIKLLSAQIATEPGEQERLLAEAHSAARLKHQGIVQVYDAGIVNGLSYFVMEYIDGYSVGQWLRRKGRLDPNDVLVVAEYAAQALAYAWESAGIIHCDIKPDNIMVDQDGTLKVADLGLARTRDFVNDGGADEAMEIMGTPSYISPEQASGCSDLDCRADIYSLGATLYHLITGKRLFEAHSDADAMEMHEKEQETDPLLLHRDLPLNLCWLIEKMLIKDRDRRYAGWAALQADLQEVSAGRLPLAPLPSPGESTVVQSKLRQRQTWREVRRQRRQPKRVYPVFIPAAVALVMIAAVGIVVLRTKNQAESSSSVAQQTEGTGNRNAASDSGGAKDSSAQDLYTFVMEWMKQHPDAYDESIYRLKQVIEATRGTRYSMMAQDALKNVTMRRDAAIEAVYQRLDAELNRLAENKQWKSASSRARSYDGPWADELRGHLQRRAADFDTSAAAQAEEEAALAAAANQRFSVFLEEFSELLLNGTVEAAQECLQRYRQNALLAIRQNEMQSLSSLINAYQGLDKDVLETFAAQVGQEITVEFLQGVRTYSLRSIIEGKLVMEQTLDGGRRVGFNFFPADLSPREYIRRLGTTERPEMALFATVHACRAGSHDRALEFLENTDPLLKPVLQRKIQLLRQAARESRALQDFNVFLQGLGIAARMPDLTAVSAAFKGLIGKEVPVAVQKHIAGYRSEYSETDFINQVDSLFEMLLAAQPPPRPETTALLDSAPAISEQEMRDVVTMLINRNPGVEGHEVRVHRDSQNRPYGLEIASSSLRDIGALTTLRGLQMLISRRSNIEDASVLSNLENLKTLHIEGFSSRDFGFLRRLRLEHLGLPRSGFSDLRLLQEMPLKELDLSHTPVRDLFALRGMPIETLNLENTPVFGIRELAGMPLRSLNLSGTQVGDLSAIRGMPLAELSAARTKVHDFSVIRGMQLRTLDVSETRFSDLSILRGMPLTRLHLCGTRITAIDELRDLPLKVLSLRNTAVSDFSPLSGGIIEWLSLEGCSRLRDLEFAAAMPLRDLNISGSGIRDISALRQLELNAFHMERTSLSDISVLQDKSIRHLGLRGSPVRDYLPLQGMPLEHLTVNDPDRIWSMLMNINSLKWVNGRSWPPMH